MAANQSVAEGIAVLDDRLRGLQASTTRAMAEQATAHAVLAQWMKDWTAEVVAWRKCIENRVEEMDARQEETGRDLEQARGAMKVALWVFGTALTLVTGVLSGVMVRVLAEVVTRTAR